ncbi:hypothetical protein [Sphingomonas sp. KC8]|uniref:hypothetical protein n=1 Tax=Sphingomonas sp. KC8 TaxID=1030157 RepID=UPI000248B585|nr:hypothetical protein [Sphingomonas sp. KC8]ARS26961.1 hypothetical protein KC8_06615 [Sphingomonas sp. KC8]
MKRTLHLLLVLGALLGLFGQAAAYASGPRALAAPVAASTTDMSMMDAECMEMMQKAPQPAEKPCKGLTLDCIAAMGCVVPIVLRDPGAPAVAPEILPTRAYWPALAVLIGHDPAPEVHPPNLFG